VVNACQERRQALGCMCQKQAYMAALTVLWWPKVQVEHQLACPIRSIMRAALLTLWGLPVSGA
jgi:hypothetical protein